jgi:hypothetical protein
VNTEALTWSSGVKSSSLIGGDGASTRRFREVKGMLRTLICHDWAQDNSNTGECPYQEKHYYRALRNYGCNCYPESDDTISTFDSTTVLWNLGNNGVPIDDVDAVCRNVWGKYHCYAYDGCHLGIDYEYHISENGNLTCGPQGAPYEDNLANFQCENAACQIEKFFAEQIYPIMGDPQAFKTNNADNYDAWQDANTCQHNRGMHLVKKECCGNYPKRVPFDGDSMECCADGKIELKGFC